MGCRPYARAFRAKDEEYEKHQELYEVCKRLDVEVPESTKEYMEANEEGLNWDELELFEDCLEVGIPSNAICEIERDYSEAFMIDLTKLPKGVVRIEYGMSS